MDEKTVVLLYTDNPRTEEVEEMVPVPDLKNKSVKEAKDLLDALGLEIEIGGIGGLAQYQKPAAGEKAAKGTKVRVEFKNP